MAQKTQHVLRHQDGGWSVKRGGSSRATKTFRTQKEAISYVTMISKRQGAELYIHRRDGLIREKNSYGNDPHPAGDNK